jgi:hypothetical protein
MIRSLDATSFFLFFFVFVFSPFANLFLFSSFSFLIFRKSNISSVDAQYVCSSSVSSSSS